MQASHEPERKPLQLRARQSQELSQAEEVVYDATFELCGYKFYIVVPPLEEQEEALRRAIQMYDKTEEHVREAMKGKRNTAQLNEALEAKLSNAERKVYGVIVQHAVVAWQPLEENAETVLFTADEQEKLSGPAKRHVSRMIIEAFR